MPIFQTDSFRSSDGVHMIQCRAWLPETAPRATLQLVHGISEHMGRYAPFARWLTEHGFAVFGHDHLGHGHTASGPEEYGSFGPRDGWDHLALDTRLLSKRIEARYPGLPHFLLGHSMGSFVARTCLIRWPGFVDGCILSGTGQENALLVDFGRGLSGLLSALRGTGSRSGLVTALSLGAYNARFRPDRTPNTWLSRDPDAVEAYNADPLCQFVPTVGMFRDMLGGIRFLSSPARIARMDPHTPILFLSGDQDPVGDRGRGVRKAARLFREAGVEDVTVLLYPGGRHEMLQELNKEQVYADVLAWLEQHLPA